MWWGDALPDVLGRFRLDGDGVWQEVLWRLVGDVTETFRVYMEGTTVKESIHVLAFTTVVPADVVDGGPVQYMQAYTITKHKPKVYGTWFLSSVRTDGVLELVDRKGRGPTSVVGWAVVADDGPAIICLGIVESG